MAQNQAFNTKAFQSLREWIEHLQNSDRLV